MSDFNTLLFCADKIQENSLLINVSVDFIKSSFKVTGWFNGWGKANCISHNGA